MQSEDNYFLQIQPNRHPYLSSMVEPGRQHNTLLFISSPSSFNKKKIIKQMRSIWISVHGHCAAYRNYNKIL